MAESGFTNQKENSSTFSGGSRPFAVTTPTGSSGASSSSSATKASSSQHRKSIATGSPKLTKVETVLCGSTAGVVSRFVIAPLDVVKIRLQLQTQRKDLPKVLRRKSISEAPQPSTKSKKADSAHSAARAINAPPKYRGMLSGMATIVREEGIRGLWKGNMAAEYLYLTYGGIQFLIYQQTKSFISKSSEASAQRAAAKHLTGTPIHVLVTLSSSSSAQSFVSGATAGIMATACTYPFDLLRTRFAIQRDVKVYTGVLQAFQHILKNEGVQGFYKGMTPALIQVIPYMGVMFGSYDTLKQFASWLKTKPDPSSDNSGLESKLKLKSTSDPPPKSVGRFLLGLEDILCGAISGIISKTAVYPLDMVRKRLQIQGSEQQRVNLGVFTSQPSALSATTISSATGGSAALKPALEALPTSAWNCMVHIVRHEGYLALYKGLLPGVLKAAPASAVTFLVFSQMGTLVERVRGTEEA